MDLSQYVVFCLGKQCRNPNASVWYSNFAAQQHGGDRSTMYGRHFWMKVLLHIFVLRGNICDDLHGFFGSFASPLAEVFSWCSLMEEKKVSEHQEKPLLALQRRVLRSLEGDISCDLYLTCSSEMIYLDISRGFQWQATITSHQDKQFYWIRLIRLEN